MTFYEGVSLVISMVSVVVAFLAVNKANSANKLSAQANEIAATANNLALTNNNLTQQATMVSLGGLEVSIASMITETEKGVRELIESRISLTSKSKLSAEEKRQLEQFEGLLGSAIEKNLNAYEELAAAYIHNRVDKTSFKKKYQVMIRQLREKPELRKYFDPTDVSRYQNIIAVYREWEGRS